MLRRTCLCQQMRGQPVDITNTINMGRNIARHEVGTGSRPKCWMQHLNALEARATRGPNGELTVPWEVAHGTRSGIGHSLRRSACTARFGTR